jgi:hypothetical protein
MNNQSPQKWEPPNIGLDLIPMCCKYYMGFFDINQYKYWSNIIFETLANPLKLYIYIYPKELGWFLNDVSSTRTVDSHQKPNKNENHQTLVQTMVS